MAIYVRIPDPLIKICEMLTGHSTGQCERADSR